MTQNGNGKTSPFYAAYDAAATASEKPPPEAVLLQMSQVQAERVRWLWPGWMPEGTLVVLDGDPGLGKSTLTLDLAARISTARAMPPLEGPDLGRKPGGVILLGAEDSLAHTVRPRLDAAGADLDRVYSLEAVRQGDAERPPVLPYDLELVADRVGEWSVKLIVVDPLMAFLGTEYDAHKDQDIRRCLHPLAKLAEKLDVTVLLLRHLNKLSGGPALYRGGSSIGISGAARASLIVGRDPDADRLVLAMNKCNLGPKPVSLAYRLESAGLGVRVVWEGEAPDLGANEILAHSPKPAPKPIGRPPDELRDACRFLGDLLCGGPMAAREVEEKVEESEHSWRTVQRAKAELGVRSFRQGGAWFWELPATLPEAGCPVRAEGDGIDTDPFPD